MSEFKDHFSTTADAYRTYRPTYPPELFAWLAGHVPRRETAVDCGCGSGQASIRLAAHFTRVVAIDPSAEQIRNAEPHPRVDYRVAPAEALPLANGTADLVIAAQALHWFDFDRFYPEVRRVCVPDGIFAAFSYGLLTVAPAIDQIIGRLYYDILGDFWPPERRHVDAAYRSLPFPFAEIAAPPFAIAAEWPLDGLLGYFATWSAVKEYKAEQGRDPLPEIIGDLAGAWGKTGDRRQVRWPLVLRVGRVTE
jgi:SAM-dependent methyltransferase